MRTKYLWSKWNKKHTVKLNPSLICSSCNLKRNRFIKNTTLCILCFDKHSKKVSAKEVKKNAK